MIDRYKHQQLRIGLVSPQQIRAWAQKMLPNGEIVGEVKKPYTFHYQTKKPEKDGLFCERIFGPIKSGICACGKPPEKENPKFCQECGVEFVDSRIRRYQMGYIKLVCPVTHVWYLKRLPSYIATLLDKPLKELDAIVYGQLCFARRIAKKPTFLRLRGSVKYEIQSWKYIVPLFFTIRGFRIFQNREIPTGAGAIREELAAMNLRIIMDLSSQEWNEFAEDGPVGDEWETQKIRRRKAFLVRRIALAKHFIRTNIEPQWMILCLLPVLPPELRPMIQIDRGRLMSSDINELYKRVIMRNNNLQKYLKINENTPGDLVMGQENLVQQAVDTLLDNGLGGQPLRDEQNRVYKSFSDLIAGKEGRFRETMLGKRVDYSARSVIVVGPSLSLHQCGLPREIALELFQTFVIRGLIRKHLASNIAIAKSQIRERGPKPFVWEILEEVTQSHPVLLNRAPTLHRLGIQAFEPILVEGRAIWLHPLVCKGFNADFDGDQMAVHVPLSLEAQTEARLLMFSHMNLRSPAIGDPICVPTQDMLMGLYVLTRGNRQGIYATRYNHPWNRRNSQNERIDEKSEKYMKEPFFGNLYDAIGAYLQKKIHFDSPLWLRWQLDQGLITSRETPIEIHYEAFGTYHEIYEHYLIVRSIKKEILCIYIRTTVGHISLYREIEEAIQAFDQVCQAYSEG